MKREQLDGTVQDEVVLMGSNVPFTQSIPQVKTSKITVETILNAASVAAGGSTSLINLNCTNEAEIYLLVNVDQQPWTLRAGAVNDVGGNYNKTVYPSRVSVATAYPNSFAPAISLYLGLNYDTATGLTTPASMQEARSVAFPPVSGILAQVSNASAVIATVTIKLIRVWR